MCDENRKRPASDTCLETLKMLKRLNAFVLALALVKRLVVVVMCRLLFFRLLIIVRLILLFADQNCGRISCVRDILEAFAFISFRNFFTLR